MDGKINHKLLKASGVTALIFAAAMLLLGVSELWVASFPRHLPVNGAGKRWSSDGERYAVIGLYTELEEGVDEYDTQGWTLRMESALIEASVTPREGARSYAFCYGADDTLTVTGPKGKATAETLAVSGDFFVFHPLKFTYGGGFLNDGETPRTVVLDRELAWRVFGAENIVGMSVLVGDEEFTVTGVAAKESTSRAYLDSYGDEPRMYMNYAGYRKVGSAGISFFEAALPNAVKGFAKDIFDQSVSRSEATSAVYELTDRFSVENRLSRMKELPSAWMRTNRIEYPYWENEARAFDYRAAVLFAFEIVFASVAVLSLFVSFVLLRFSGWSALGSVKKLLRKAAENRRRNRGNRKKPGISTPDSE